MAEEVFDTNHEELQKLADIAFDYYQKGLSQSKIAKKMDLTQPEVSRCLLEAKEKGIIEIIINPLFTSSLAEELKKKFSHLREVIITPYSGASTNKPDPLLKEFLGIEAAKYFLKTVRTQTKIGISCGSTLIAFIEELKKERNTGRELPAACTIASLAMLVSKEIVAFSPSVLVADLVRILPQSHGIAYHLPPVLLKANMKKGQSGTYMENPNVKTLFEEIEEYSYYLVGIGEIDFERENLIPGSTSHEFNSVMWEWNMTDILKKQDAVGEIAYQPIGRDGENLLGENLENKEYGEFLENILCVPLSALHKHVQENTATVVGIAGGFHKRDAVHAALKSKTFNVLITDPNTVSYILKKPSS